MKTTFRKLALALAASAATTTAHAGVLSFQDVVFTTSWTNNVLTLEIDAAQRGGDWSRATLLSALSIKEIGSFNSVSLTGAPEGVDAWKMSSRELNAKGCAGGGRSRTSTSLCLSGAPIALTDNMVFTFAFTGTPDLDEPHLKVSFLDSSYNKAGDLLSQTITASTVVIPPPGTPVIPPVTPPVTPPVVPPVVPPVTPPVTPPVVTPPIVTPPLDQLPDPTDVPEPQSIALLLAGLGLMGLALRKRG